MKNKSIFSVAILMLFLGSVSCEKIVDKIFSGTDVNVPAIDVDIPPIPQIAVSFGEIPLGNFSQDFNLDSAVKANTAGVFGVNVVSSVKIKTITIATPNGDDNNNLSNFESARVLLSSKNNTTEVTLLNLTFPTTATTTLTVSPTDSPELLPYLKDGKLNYRLFGKARRGTSKELNMQVTVVARVK